MTNYILVLPNRTCVLDCLIPHYKCVTCTLGSGVVQCQTCQTNYIVPAGLNTCVLNCNAFFVGCSNCSENNATSPVTYTCHGCQSGFVMSGNGTCIASSTTPGTINAFNLQF